MLVLLSRKVCDAVLDSFSTALDGLPLLRIRDCDDNIRLSDIEEPFNYKRMLALVSRLDTLMLNTADENRVVSSKT